MGVWMDLYIAPENSRTLSHHEFEGLIRNLATAHLARLPATLFIGDVDPQHPLEMSNRAFDVHNRQSPAAYHGCDLDALLQALRDAPYHEQDLCIHFESLDWNNADLHASFEQHNFANGDVVVYALSRPRLVYIWDAYKGSHVKRRLQDFFTTTGKGGPWKIAGTPLEPVLTRYFGPTLSVDCAYS